MFWASLAIQNKLVREIENRLKQKKRERFVIFFSFFMARKIQIKFRKYLLDSLHRKKSSQKLNRNQVLEFINLKRLKYSFHFFGHNEFTEKSINCRAFNLLDNFF